MLPSCYHPVNSCRTELGWIDARRALEEARGDLGGVVEQVAGQMPEAVQLGTGQYRRDLRVLSLALGAGRQRTLAGYHRPIRRSKLTQLPDISLGSTVRPPMPSETRRGRDAARLTACEPPRQHGPHQAWLDGPQYTMSGRKSSAHRGDGPRVLTNTSRAGACLYSRTITGRTQTDQS